VTNGWKLPTGLPGKGPGLTTNPADHRGEQVGAVCEGKPMASRTLDLVGCQLREAL
jgi:hypothetical protein